MSDLYLIFVSAMGIALSIWLIARRGFHPFFGLLCAALAIAIAAGRSADLAVADIQKGFGDILGGTGLVVTMGLALGTILQMSGGAASLANAIFGLTGPKYASFGAMLTALILGMPLFFETGVVLLIPIISAGLPAQSTTDRQRLTVMLSALAGLSVLHALLPPHPGPLIAIKGLGGTIDHVLPLGMLIAIPTAILAGPLLARFTLRKTITTAPPLLTKELRKKCSPWAAAAVLLLPVGLIASGALMHTQSTQQAQPTGRLRAFATMVSEPSVALLLAILAGLILLVPKALTDKRLQESIWTDTLRAAAPIVLSIGAGGALKQVLIGIGLPGIFGKLASVGIISPLFVAWVVAAAIRVSTGSATVATITTAGVMSAVVAQSGIAPEWFVLAIGAGSVFLSHVNDPGFWVVKGYLGTSTTDTIRLWSTLESAISIVGLLILLGLYYGARALALG